MLWLKDNRSKIAKAGMSVIDVSRAAGVEWGKVKDKSKWEKQVNISNFWTSLKLLLLFPPIRNTTIFLIKRDLLK